MRKIAGIVRLAEAPSLGSVIALFDGHYIVTAASRLDDSDDTEDFQVNLVGPYDNADCALMADGQKGQRVAVKASDRLDMNTNLKVEVEDVAYVAELAREK